MRTAPLVKVRFALAALLAFAWVGACLDDPAGLKPPPPPAGLVVSDPVLPGTTGAASGPFSAAVLGEGASVVYVSLLPGTEPAGVTATVRAVTSDATATTAVRDGGFDPVAVVAQVGDTIEVMVRDVSGAVVLPARMAVARMRAPIVVRTDPPPGKRDVPLNAYLMMVFSEPIDSATLTALTVQLKKGTVPVSGRVAFRDADHLTAAFVPATLLLTSADYQLTITQGIRDLNGESLEAPVTVPFTTVPQPPPPPAGVSRIAFWGGGIRTMNADGSDVRILTTLPTDYDPAWSPDGAMIAFSGNRLNPGLSDYDIYVMNNDGSGIRRLTTLSSQTHAPAWSPDGTRIAFLHDGATYVVNASDGSGLTSLGPGGCCSDDGLAWSPDGRRIAFSRDHIYVMNVDGSGVSQLTSGPSRDRDLAWSPDGGRLAFLREDTVYVMNALDGSGATRVTSVGGGFGGPAWSPDGRAIAFGGFGGIAIMSSDGSDVRQVAPGTSPAWSLVGTMPPPPSLSLQKLGGDGQTDTVLATLAEPLRVLVLRNKAPVPGLTVSWTLEDDAVSQGGSLAARTSVTDAAGVASMVLTLGPVASTHGVLAGVTDVVGSPAVAFTVGAKPGMPVAIRGGRNSQLALVDSTLRYCVDAHDGHGPGSGGENAVSGIPVTWAVTSGGGSINPAQDTTGYSGAADRWAVACTAHTLGSSDGVTQVTATAPTIPGAAPVIFTTTTVVAIVRVIGLYGERWIDADSVVVPSGRTVGWNWQTTEEGDDVHNITFEDDPTQPTSSPTLGPFGGAFTRMFSGGPRTIRYRCTLHSTSFTEGEVGSVIVQ